ncbi:14424_t:CDS:10, partial [Acaulospora morrowiae]
NEMEKDLTVESKEVPEVLEKPLGEPLNLVVNNSETNTNIYEPEQKHLVETTSDVISDAQPSTSLEEPQPNQLSQEHTNPVYVESPKSHENSETVESQKQINIPEQLEQDKSSIPKNEIVRVPESIEIPQPPPSNQPDIESTPEVGKNDENPVDNSMVTDAPSQSPIAANPGSQVEFNTAMAKVKEIAAKLGVKPTVESTSPQNHNNSTATQQGVKRSHDDSYSSHGSRDSRDEYRDEYRRDSYNRRERGNRYDDYGRESKRTAYDVDNGGRHRYGLGSEERRSYHGSHYGPGGDSSRSTTHEEFKVPNAVVGLVIGRGGENLKRIEKQTGARIQFSQDQPPDVVERRVTITGTQEDVKSAKAMVQQLVEDAINGNSTSRRDSQGFNRSITIHIPSSKVGVVIGRGGETIRDLQDRSGARINVTPDSAASPQSNDRPVTLIGDESAVQRAKALIDEIVNTGESSLSDRHSKDYRSNSYSGASTYSNDSHGSNYGGGGGHYGPPSGHYGGPPGGKSSQDGITIQVPNDSVGLIIGKGGETVRALQQQSGARIQIEPVHGVPPAERNVQITGSSENIAIAKQLILEKAASGNDYSSAHFVDDDARERPSRHGDQGRGDYGSGNYQQSSYQQ